MGKYKSSSGLHLPLLATQSDNASPLKYRFVKANVLPNKNTMSPSNKVLELSMDMAMAQNRKTCHLPLSYQQEQL
jgi:hypothetical protein